MDTEDEEEPAFDAWAETEQWVTRKIGFWGTGLDLAWGMGEGRMEEENESDDVEAIETTSETVSHR